MTCCPCKSSAFFCTGVCHLGCTSRTILTGLQLAFMCHGCWIVEEADIGLVMQGKEGTDEDRARCDSLGHFLPDDTPPPLFPVQRSPDDWAPFCSQLEFELAEFLFQHAEMPANQIDTLLELWAVLILELGGSPLFTNHMDLYCVIDSMSVGKVKWENFKITHKHKQDGQEGQDDVIKLVQGHEDDLHQVVHNLLRHTDLKDEMDFVPYQEFNATTDERHWEDFMSGDWAWDEVNKIIHNDPSTVRATLVPIILGSDKTTVSIATGQTDYYPLYLSIGNVHNTTHSAHCDAVVLIGFLAMLKTTREHANTPAFRKFKKQLLHLSLGCILRSLHAVMTIPETVLFSDQYYWHVIYSLAAYIADYEEQVLLLGIMHNWCPKCLAYQETLDEDALCGFPCADIQRMLLLDILHQLIKGGFKDHLVDWVEKCLYCTHSKSVYIAAIEGYVPQDMVHTFHAFLEFCYLIHQNVITESMFTVIEDALACFHLYHEVFWDANIITTFSLPQQHAMKHYPYLICQFSAPNGLCSSITKSKHIKAVKWPYRHTNHFQALRQMLIINERLDKFAAACADFKRCGMLRGTCLSHLSGTAGNCEDSANKPTASFEEDLGDMVDSPMSVEAHQSNLTNPTSLIRYTIFFKCRTSMMIMIDVLLDKCPFYDGSIHVSNSVSLTFYLPSDVSGLHSMHHEYIQCSPMWRKEGPCYDCVLVVTNPHAEGMLGLDIAHYLGAEYPCVIICWFDCVGDGPDPNTGMWKVCTHNAQDISIIHLDTVYCAAQLIPIYASHESVDPASVKPNQSYDKFHTFYVNKFADHHAFEITY
ncbi:hypothetical protein EDC04DRAFT_2871876 [Pisolithus marmoratus]|nr:hypothetical protein EDC04DRAFT_2871876 [Pisolithus marmoratus]